MLLKLLAAVPPFHWYVIVAPCGWLLLEAADKVLVFKLPLSYINEAATGDVTSTVGVNIKVQLLCVFAKVGEASKLVPEYEASSTYQ